MGSLSSEPAHEAFWRDKADRAEIVRGLGGLGQGGYCAAVIEDASFVAEYGSIRPTYCSVLLIIANFFENF